MDDAIAAAKAQWQKGVWQDVQLVSTVFEAVEGQLQLDEDVARGSWPDGETYEGSYHQGKSHGHGVYKFADGNSYVGQWRKGLRHGRGTFKWANGASYSGDFENDDMHGHASGAVAVLSFEADRPKRPGRAAGEGLRPLFPPEGWRGGARDRQGRGVAVGSPRRFSGWNFMSFYARLRRSSRSRACRSCRAEHQMAPKSHPHVSRSESELLSKRAARSAVPAWHHGVASLFFL